MGEQWLTGAGNAVGEQGLGSTPALTVLHWHKELALHSLLLDGKARGWWGSVVPQNLSLGRKTSFLHWRAGLWEPQLLGYSSSSSCILMELTRRLHCPQWSSLLSCRPAEHHLGFQQRAASPWQEGLRDPLA